MDCRLGRRVLAPFSAVTIALLSSGRTFADQTSTGWSHNSDGSYTHDASGIDCPSAVKDFSFQKLNAVNDPNVVASCEYSGVDGGIGEIRIRPTTVSPSDTPPAASDGPKMFVDPNLISQPSSTSRNTDSDAADCMFVTGRSRLYGPRIATSLTICDGAGPEISGEATGRRVVTVAYRGYFIDCLAWEKTSVPEYLEHARDFAAYCFRFPVKAVGGRAPE